MMKFIKGIILGKHGVISKSGVASTSPSLSFQDPNHEREILRKHAQLNHKKN